MAFLAVHPTSLLGVEGRGKASVLWILDSIKNSLHSDAGKKSWFHKTAILVKAFAWLPVILFPLLDLRGFQTHTYKPDTNISSGKSREGAP